MKNRGIRVKFAKRWNYEWDREQLGWFFIGDALSEKKIKEIEEIWKRKRSLWKAKHKTGMRRH